MIGKVKCQFYKATKKLLAEWDNDNVEAPTHLFPHLILDSTKTVRVIYLDKKLVGGYGNLREYFEVEDTFNAE